MKRTKQINPILSFFVIFVSCNVLNYYAEIEINEDFISSSRGLINGIRFEKLSVQEIGEKGYPIEYLSVRRFQCYNPGVDGVQDYWPKKIFFKKKNGHYKWKTDVVNISYMHSPKYRERIRKSSDDSIVADQKNDTLELKPEFHFDEMFLPGSEVFDICPVAFENDTWYFLDFQDPTLSAVYLNINSQGTFKIYKVNSGVSPI